ncbi:MAG: hypothetical protein MRZ66_01740 [Clostridiales bacterium]|nr:hypothetical protein [Clostridiales bacterium]
MFGILLVGYLAMASWEGTKAKAQDIQMENWARSRGLSGYHDHKGRYIKFEDKFDK